MLSAKEYATQAHCGQKYGEHAYPYHLQQVVTILIECGYADADLIDAAWLHDIVEDTPITIVDIVNNFNFNTATMVYACTGEGKNRKERQANIKEKLIRFGDACIIKTADRTANMEEAARTVNLRMCNLYYDEYSDFYDTVKRNINYTLESRLYTAYKQICEVLQV